MKDKNIKNLLTACRQMLGRLLRPTSALSHNGLILAAYFIVFSLLFWQIRHGVGQYWDWSFPYFQDSIGNFFARASESWSRDNNGSALGYSSDFFLRFVISSIRFLQPETLLYIIVVSLFSIGSFGIYLISRNYTRASVAFLLGLAAFANPAIFYKYVAGYIDYLFSYVIFIYLVRYLLFKYRKDLFSAIVVGLFLAVIGIQIQFFVIVPMFILIFFMLHRWLWSWKHASIMLAIAFSANIVWLMNFILGAASVTDISASASKGGFQALSVSNFLNIFTFSFSRATLIDRFYLPIELIIHVFSFVVLIALVIRSKKKKINDLVLLGFMLLMVLLNTGIFLSVNLGPLTILYPMFREVGHFSPFIIMMMLLLAARMIRNDILGKTTLCLLSVIIVLAASKYITNPQSVNFGSTREKLATFEEFSKEHDSENVRTLMYPFYDPYYFKDTVRKTDKNNLPIQNAGHDSFSAYAAGKFVSNAIKPQSFTNSVQTTLLKTRDIDVLKPYNVKYLYNLSDIYESSYDKYVSSSVYGNTKSLIRNDPNFFDKLLAANPGKVRLISKNILEITDYAPAITIKDTLFETESNFNSAETLSFIDRAFDAAPYYTSDASQQKQHTNISPVLSELSQKSIGNGSLNQTLTLPKKNVQPKLYVNDSPQILDYNVSNSILTIRAVSTGKLYINDKLVVDNEAKASVIKQVPIMADRHYYVLYNNEITPVSQNSGTLGGILPNGSFQIYSSDKNNIIKNGSFEEGLWQKSVTDCHKYDADPQISMVLDNAHASNGKSSLRLSSTRHDACTFTSFIMKPSAKYLLEYAYKSTTADRAGFTLHVNNSFESYLKGSQIITDSGWHSNSKFFETPQSAKNGQLYLTSSPKDNKTAQVNYDNVTLTQLQLVQEATIPEYPEAYDAQTIEPSTNVKISFVDQNYTYKNVVENGSFETGLWQNQVTDCNAHDNRSNIAMRRISDAEDGKYSLQLEATRHIACTYNDIKVEPEKNYLLTFSYKGINTKQIGYEIDYDNTEAPQKREQQEVVDDEWHAYSTTIQTPSRTATARLKLFAYESDGKQKNITQFDNLRLVAVPVTNGRFFIVTPSEDKLIKPKKLTVKSQTSTSKKVLVQSVSTPFFLSLSETFNPKWKLATADESYSPVHTINSQYKLSNYSNGWYIDPKTFCTDNGKGCTKNADGTYDIKLVAQFTPQKWFKIALILSSATLIGGVGYVIYTSLWKRFADEGSNSADHKTKTKKIYRARY